ncbi:MAG: lactate racemase domain-containing protein, partial [Clostridia bacterium]
MELCLRANAETGLTDEQIKTGLISLMTQHPAKKVLIIPPDFTRYFSKAGFITNVCYHYYTDQGAHVDILPALGTHVPMTKEQVAEMFCDVPFDRFIAHNWRS